MRIRLGTGVAAVAAAVATGAFGVTGSDKITTIAGIGKFGTGGFSGDGGRATSAQLSQPHAVAVDGQGSVYIADSNNNRVRKVSLGGTIATFAGTGTASGFSGDGGPATLAYLSSPRGVAVDGQRNLYIADYANNRVRKVNPGGTITTFAGTGIAGFSGDGGPAASAQLVQPHGVAVDGGGNVYIGEYRGHRVRKVSPGGTITTLAGTGKAGFSGDGGPATSAQLYAPAGVAVDAKGNVYIADQQNHRVRKVSPSGTITTFAGTAANGFSGEGRPATSAQLANPFGVAADKEGNVYIADASPPRVLKVAGGRLTRIAGRDPRGRSGGLGEGGPATSAQLSAPFGVAVDGKGNVYLADAGYHTVRKVWNGSAAAGLQLHLAAASPQPLLSQQGIRVTASCNTRCSLTGSGKVTILGTSNIFPLSGANASLSVAGSKKLTLRFSAVAQRQFRLFLKPGQRAQAKITVRATDKAGRSTTATRIVAVRSSSSGGSSSGSAELRTFVDRIGRILTQSAAGRRELGSAIAAGLNCSISARAAGQRVDRVVANRQSLLTQLRGLPAPSAQAVEALALLRLGLQHSIEADIRYRDGFFNVRTSGCPLPPNANFTLARKSDVRASAAKQRFVAVFNPLAKSVNRRTWSASEI